MSNILELKHITKAYPGVIALDDVSLSFQAGEVHALLGENGAGKSTLIKIIAGAVEADSGEIHINGEKFNDISPLEARKAGVEVIYQEFNLVDTLSAGENIFLGERLSPLVNQRKMHDMAAELFREFNVDIDPAIPVRELPSSKQQIVEIVKSVSRNAKILIMDEPTAPLTISEVDTLFSIIRRLKENGVTIIYISHRMEEIFQISDRVSVLRDGQFIHTLETAGTNRSELISLMVGRELNSTFPARKVCGDEVVLKLTDVSGNGDQNISLELHKGEILGLAGLVGAGRSELAKVIYGAEKLEGGSIAVNGEEVNITSPADAMRHGIGLIPENRKEEGCFLGKGIDWNIVISSLDRFTRGIVLNSSGIGEFARSYQKKLNIRTPSVTQLVGNLSGGNQQKVVISKTLAAESQILIFDEPTRGIDVGARQEIYQLMADLVAEGHSIIMISSDMEELLGMSDRIIVLSDGRISGELERQEFSQQRVLELASLEKQHSYEAGNI